MSTSPTIPVPQIYFPEGLVGCPEWRLFTPEQLPGMEPVALLRCVDQPELSLIVADPRVWYPGYEFEVSPADLDALDAARVEDLALLSILTVEPDPFAVTANLLGPLVINPANGRARQIVQSSHPYLARQPVAVQAQALTFSEGLVGCPNWRRFFLRQMDKTEPIQLLVLRDQRDISLPVVDPRLVDPAYAPELDEVDRAALGVTDDDSVGWLSILTVQNDPFKVTANLLGPIAFNPRTGAARQVLLSQSGYAAAHPLGDGRLLMGSEVDHARSYATV